MTEAEAREFVKQSVLFEPVDVVKRLAGIHYLEHNSDTLVTTFMLVDGPGHFWSVTITGGVVALVEDQADE